jgi:hypothetical protein
MKHLALGRNWAATLALLSVLVLAPQAGFSALPQTLNYQGSLADSIGDPVNGTVDMTFSLYSTETGGTALWTETQSVPVTEGVFNVRLGAVVPLVPWLFNNRVYLGVAVGLDAEMTPRQLLDVFAYSMRAHGALVGFSLTCVACVDEAELTFDPATQAELDGHAGAAGAHHARYTDAEAVTAVGPHTTDTDTLGGLSCASGEIASWNGAAWACAADADTADTQLSDAEVDAFVVNGALDLFAGTTLGGAAIQTGADADTQLSDAEVDAFVVNGALDLSAGTTLGGAAIQTGADADTQLSEAEVETFVTNGAVDLFAGTTLGGAAIQTGTDADTLGGLVCSDGEVAKKALGAWSCAADDTGGTASDLTCTGCVAETELGFDTANQTELDSHSGNAAAHHTRYTDAEAVSAVGPHTADTDTDTLADLVCADGQVAKKVLGVWNCAADDTGGGLSGVNVPTNSALVTAGLRGWAAGSRARRKSSRRAAIPTPYPCHRPGSAPS